MRNDKEKIEKNGRRHKRGIKGGIKKKVRNLLGKVNLQES